MKKFNVKPLGAIISGLVMAAASQSVLAQTAGQDEPVVEEITVTGFAKSIVNAIEMKRNADTVVEAISAEDIGGLPDKSIADSLSRLPGITVTRKGGQAGTIQARGMGDGYVFSTLNGREQVSPSGARAMEFSQFPSELINSVEVYKSPKASLIEGGVAATVELKTVKPLDIADDRKVTVGIRGSYNDQANDLYDTDPLGHRVSFSYQQKLLDDTLGFSLGYAQLKEPKAALSFEQFQYDKLRGDKYTANGMKVLQEGGTSERDGYMATVQFEPNEQLSIEADAFYSKFDTNSNSRGLFFDNTPAANLYNPTYYGNFITGGNLVKNPTDTGGGMSVKVVDDNASTNYELFSGGLNLVWKNDALTLSADLSHSDASGYSANGNGISNLYVRDSGAAGGYVIDNNQQVNYQLDGVNLPNIAVNGDYTNFDKLRLTSQSYYPYLNEDAIDAARFDVKYEFDDLPIITSVEAGVRYSERNHKETRALFTYGTGSDGSVGTDYSLPINANTSDLVNWKGSFSRFPSFLAVDGDRILQGAADMGLVLMSNDTLDAYDSYGNVRPRSTLVTARWTGAPWSFTQNSNIDENVTSLYTQVNLKTEVLDRDLTGNVGFRYVRTDQSNRSLADVGGDAALGAVNICDATGVCNDTYAYQRIGVKYNNFLPSLNLNYHLTENDQLRFAVARVMSRAPIAKLSSFDFGSVDKADARGPVYNYGDSKSPTLKPFIADQIDVSYEHYLEEATGSFSVAAYYRKIKSFIQDKEFPDYDFAGNGYLIPATVTVTNASTSFIPTELPVLNGTFKTALNNDKGGFIKGLEFAYTQTFDFLPGAFSGLGFSGSASFTDSEISVANTVANFTDEKLEFPGLVKRSANFTVFYSYESFETRLSTTYQAAFVGESRTIGPNTSPVTYAPETVLDYQASYKFDAGVDVVFSVGNLTNEPNRSYMFDENLPLKLNWFGRTYNLGVNYAF